VSKRNEAIPTGRDSLNGAQALISSLVAAGVEVCFMNPGTSEMHFVQALDSVPAMHSVLALFEGVATGAADGYARTTGRPAAVLLHLGPGLGNGMANLHNAWRAHSPLLCIVGAHATGHVRYDAPLQSDISAVARTVSGWVHTSGTARDVAGDAMRAVAATRESGGQIATLILPADVSWSEGAAQAAPYPLPPQAPPLSSAIAAAGGAVRGGPKTLLLLGGRALTADGLAAASRVAIATGVRVLVETFPTRMEAGAGIPVMGRLAYLAEKAEQQLTGVETLVLVGARSPVSFFAYPGKNSDLVPPGCEVLQLADAGQDAEAAVVALADVVAPGVLPQLAEHAPTPPEPGPLNVANLAASIAVTLPSDAIVVDEANTSGLRFPAAFANAARHSLLTLTGGAIGQGLPVATGAAIGAPDRPVLSIEADGSALYTIQSLWTQARERSNVTTVLINNAAYAILRMELARTGAGAEAGAASARMLDLSDPTPNFVGIADGLGVPATRATTAEQLVDQLTAAYAEPGPHLIEAIVPSIL
jgi:acetolactate synthase I/II/III large subunit